MKRPVLLSTLVAVGALSIAVAGFQNPPPGGPGPGRARVRGAATAGAADPRVRRRSTS